MDTDPFPAAVERLIATHDVGVPPTVFPNRKVSRGGAVPAPRPLRSPGGSLPPALVATGVPSDGGEPPFATEASAVGCSGRGAAPPDAGEATVLPSIAAPTGALGRGEGASGGNDAGGSPSAPEVHPTPPAGFLCHLARAAWRAVTTRSWPDLAPIDEENRREAVLRHLRGLPDCCEVVG